MEQWDNVLQLRGAHVDVNAHDRTNVQLVVNDSELMDRLYRDGFISIGWRQPEFLLRGFHAHLQQHSPTVTGPVLLPGIFYPHDFKKAISDIGGNGSHTVYELERRLEGLLFKRLYVRSGESGYFRHGMGGPHQQHVTYVFERETLIPHA